jgi:hypothetical protein
MSVLLYILLKERERRNVLVLPEEQQERPHGLAAAVEQEPVLPTEEPALAGLVMVELALELAIGVPEQSGIAVPVSEQGQE